MNNRRKFIDFLRRYLKHVEKDNLLWFAWPKGPSGVNTAINHDTVHTTAEEFGITAVAVISIDNIRSVLLFRLVERVGK